MIPEDAPPDSHGSGSTEQIGVPAWLHYADAALRWLVHSNVNPTADGVAEAPSLDEARQRLLDSLDVTVGFGALAHNARLSTTDCEILALVIACEIDTRRQALLALAQRGTVGARVTMHSLSFLLGGLQACADSLGPSSRLRRAALLDVVGDETWGQLTVVPPLALVWAFAGDGSPDPDLPPGAHFVEDLLAPQLEDFARFGEVVVAYGPDRVRRRAAAMAGLGGQLFLVSSQPESDRSWAALVREATMGGSAIVLQLDGALSPDSRRWIDRADHLSFAITAASELPIDALPERPLREIETPSLEMSDAEWARLFGNTPRTHRLTPQQAEQVAKIYAARDHDIHAAVRRLLAGPLESLAQRIRPRSSWDDLVLSSDLLDQLRSIVSRYRNASQVYDRWGFSATPSRGLVALFSGPSGTGKTLAAEVLAGELGLDMFKLDLSSVVSKYIGETEKNLDQVFDAAGVGNVVLFFDEADALFGKRSEVKDARDRYANVEVSYLLQRVEAFDGVVVLATNFEKSIDDAFLRRIHSRIAFVLPEPSERLAIWRRHLPSDALLDDVDLDWLSTQIDLSGGQIRNAAVHSAFLAAATGTLIGMSDLVRGVAQELRKAGRLLRPETFGQWYTTVAD